MNNPLLEPFKGLHGTAPFAQIDESHFKPAFKSSRISYPGYCERIEQGICLAPEANAAAMLRGAKISESGF